jgi:splicing factor 3A subunit 1
VCAAPKAPASAAAEDWVSPLTGEKIAPDKIQEHLRIGLLDPKWIEQRDRQIREKQHEEEVLARGTSIEQSLKKLAERRTDIFGLGAEETQIGKKVIIVFLSHSCISFSFTKCTHASKELNGECGVLMADR